MSWKLATSKIKYENVTHKWTCDGVESLNIISLMNILHHVESCWMVLNPWMSNHLIMMGSLTNRVESCWIVEWSRSNIMKIFSTCTSILFTTYIYSWPVGWITWIYWIVESFNTCWIVEYMCWIVEYSTRFNTICKNSTRFNRIFNTKNFLIFYLV